MLFRIDKIEIEKRGTFCNTKKKEDFTEAILSLFTYTYTGSVLLTYIKSCSNFFETVEISDR